MRRKVPLAMLFTSLLFLGLPLQVEAQVNNPSAVEQANINLAIQNFQSLLHELQNQHGYPKANFDRYNATLANLQYMNGANKIKSVPGLQAGTAGYNENGGPPEHPAAAYCPPGGYTQVRGNACPDDTIIVDPSYLDPNNGVALNESNPVDWGKKWNLTSVLIHEKQHEMYVKEALDTLHAKAWWNTVTNKDQRNTNAIAAALSQQNHGQVYQIQKQNLKDLLKSLDNQIKHSTSAAEKRDLNIKKTEITKFLGLLKNNERRMFGGGGLAKFEECGWPNNFHDGNVALFMTSPSIWERLDMQVKGGSIVNQTITQTRWEGESDIFSPVTVSPSLFITASEQTLFDLSVLDDSCDYYSTLMQTGDISYSTSIPLLFSVAIPEWIKTDAELWSDGSISDKDFATAIGWLIQHKIISVNVQTNSDGTITVDDGIHIPKWIKDDAFWWSQGTIQDSDFMSAIEYMINQKIISFSGSEPSILSQIESQNGIKTGSSTGTSNAGVMQLQSKYGTYEPSSQSTPDRELYDVLCTWVLKSQNGIEHKAAHVRFTNSAGNSIDVTESIKDGVIHTDYVLGPDTWTFTLVTIDGLAPPTDNAVEIVIHAKPASGTPSTVQTTPGTSLTQNTLEFSVPSTITQEATSSSGAVVSFTTTFSPGGSGQAIVTCNPASGSHFPLGNTIVTCTATDPSSQKTLQKTFSVIVQDTTGPAIAPFAPHNDTPDDSGAVVYFTASATDLVDGPVSVHCNYESGTKFPLGVTVITCTADDSHGNHASRSLQISITKS
ncbi:exported protein of unknown function [Nitrosotalea devaniterrae]|uniref:HYR domain-containing protein n=1 Tax=Nitrosotalea devaniterrae TaxID=1078905 RepID=A0A128A4G7_9ARCH|nr:exported protein of unknown function [Candidatus Nitrosotalea devanaterra]